MTEPRTEAGRRMLYDWQARRTHPPTEARQESYRQFILVIEAEATAAAEQRLRERIEALTLDPRFNDHYHRGWGKHRAAVLALLSKEPE